MKNTILMPAMICSIALLLIGCGGSETETQTNTSAAWQLSSPPNSPASIIQTKANAQTGDTVTLTGKIGGSVDGGISVDSGIFLLVDHAIPTCNELEDDHCPAPWDYCCEPRDSLMNAMATVLVVDDAGNPIKLDGLKPLDEVIITGTVGERPEPTVLTVTAQGVYVAPTENASDS